MGLNSTSVIKLVDLLCEGTIAGFVPDASKAIYLDETPIKAADGGDNFTEETVSYDFRLGGRSQERLDNYVEDGSSTVVSINTEVGENYSETLDDSNEVVDRTYGSGHITRQITDTQVDSFQVLFTIPALFSTAQEGLAKGQLFNATIELKVHVQDSKGGGFVEKYSQKITGISTTEYQIKTPTIVLDSQEHSHESAGPWNVKIEKITDGENDFEISYENFEEISQTTPLSTSRGNRAICTAFIEKKKNFTNNAYSACVGLSLSTRQFTSMPTRAYLIKGIKVMIPDNATVRDDGSLEFIEGREFTGALIGPRWTTCPVCCFYDMLTNSRYGAGDFIDSSNVNWIDLYPLCQYANQLVSNPDGSQEPRFAINTVIGDQSDAYNVLQDLAGVFRGMTYWASNTIQVTGDHGNLDGSDIDPVHLYTNSNVTDGLFNYSGTSLKTRSTSIRVRYNDPDNFYKPNFIVVEDQALITKYGYQIKDVIAFGCTSKYQARRMGRWMMAAEEIDQEVVSFSCGLDAVAVFPGQVFAIADETRQGVRAAGRVVSVSEDTREITVDQAYWATSDFTNPKLTCVMPNGDVETRNIYSRNGNVYSLLTLFSAAPQVNSVWSIKANQLAQQKFRCLSIDENGDGTYSITATEFNDSIYSTADTGSKIEFEDVTAFDSAPVVPVNIRARASEIRINENTVNRLAFSWSRGSNGASVSFNVAYRTGATTTNWGAWSFDSTERMSYDIDGLAPETNVQFFVQAVGPGPLNKRSSWAGIAVKVPSKSTTETPDGDEIAPVELPPNPERIYLSATSKDEVIFQFGIPNNWGGNPKDLTAVIRHSDKTDGTGTWQDSTKLRETPVTSDSIVLPLLEGEYLVKFRDIAGNYSEIAGSGVIDLPDTIPRLIHITRREDADSPPFQGEKNDVFYSDEYDALVLDGDAHWDEKTENIDTWGSIDFLGDNEMSGTYFFNNVVDLGAVMESVVFKRKLRTRGLFPSNTLDDRTSKMDTWSDFDGDAPDETSAVMYFRKSNGSIATSLVDLEDGDTILMEDSDNAEQELDVTFGDWVPMENGRYTGRLFQFKVVLESDTDDQTPLIDELGYTIEFDSRTESNSFASGAGAKAVTYTKAFLQTPKIGITASNLATGDYYEITSESRTGFTITFKNSSGSAVDRTFAYQANGYGSELS